MYGLMQLNASSVSQEQHQSLLSMYTVYKQYVKCSLPIILFTFSESHSSINVSLFYFNSLKRRTRIYCFIVSLFLECTILSDYFIVSYFILLFLKLVSYMISKANFTA